MTRTRVDVEGGAVELEVTGCVAFRTGEFAGNLDVELSCAAGEHDDELAEKLRLWVPGVDEPLEPDGWARVDDKTRLVVTFHCEELAEGDVAVPATVDLLAGELPLASVPCARAKDEPLAVDDWLALEDHEGALEIQAVSSGGKNLSVQPVACGAFPPGGPRSNVLYVKVRVAEPRPEGWPQAVKEELTARIAGALEPSRVVGGGPWEEVGMILTLALPAATGEAATELPRVELFWRDRSLGTLACTTFVSTGGSGNAGCSGALFPLLLVLRALAQA